MAAFHMPWEGQPLARRGFPHLDKICRVGGGGVSRQR